MSRIYAPWWAFPFLAMLWLCGLVIKSVVFVFIVTAVMSARFLKWLVAPR